VSDTVESKANSADIDAIVTVHDVEKEYPLGKLTVRALRGVSLEIERGDFAVIAGPSGSGKTTLLNLIGCVDVPTAGEVTVDGQLTNELDDKGLTELRLHKLGFIFQSFNLIGVLDVFQNVEFPLMLKGGLSKRERRERVEHIVERVGLSDQMHQRPNELSGGQRQRVAIARALVTRPRIVLADEPTANLDSKTGNQIIELMREINAQEDTTFIFSTHDPKVMVHAQRKILLEDGRVSPESGDRSRETGDRSADGDGGELGAAAGTDATVAADDVVRGSSPGDDDETSDGDGSDADRDADAADGDGADAGDDADAADDDETSDGDGTDAGGDGDVDAPEASAVTGSDSADDSAASARQRPGEKQEAHEAS